MKSYEEQLQDLLIVLAFHPKYSFYAYMLMSMEVKLNPKIKTARIKYLKRKFRIELSPKFLFETLPSSHDEIERCTLLVHEVQHAMYLHNLRRGDRDSKRWNRAGDLCINQFIFKNLPENSVLASIGIDLGPSYPFEPNLTAEQYYELLPEEVDGEDDNEADDGEGEEGDTGLGNDCVAAQGISDVEIEMIKQEMQGLANRAKQKCRGNVGSDANTLLDWLNMPSVVDWRHELRDVAGNKRILKEPTIKRRDRRQPSRMDLCGKTTRNGFTVACIVDESGSMPHHEIMKGVVELNEVCELTKSDVWFVHCDTEASAPEQFDRFAPGFTRKKSGGTYLWPGVQKLREHEIEFDALIVITDGEIESHWPEVLDIPVFFLLTSDSLYFDLKVSSQYKKFKLKDIK